MNIATYSVIKQNEIDFSDQKLLIKLLKSDETKKYYYSMSHYVRGSSDFSSIPYLNQDGFDSEDDAKEFLARYFLALNSDVVWIENENF